MLLQPAISAGRVELRKQGANGWGQIRKRWVGREAAVAAVPGLPVAEHHDLATVRQHDPDDRDAVLQVPALHREMALGMPPCGGALTLAHNTKAGTGDSPACTMAGERDCPLHTPDDAWLAAPPLTLRVVVAVHLVPHGADTGHPTVDQVHRRGVELRGILAPTGKGVPALMREVTGRWSKGINHQDTQAPRSRGNEGGALYLGTLVVKNDREETENSRMPEPGTPAAPQPRMSAPPPPVPWQSTATGSGRTSSLSDLDDEATQRGADPSKRRWPQALGEGEAAFDILRRCRRLYGKKQEVC